MKVFQTITNRNNMIVMLQATLVVGLLFLVPTLKYPAQATSTDEFISETTVLGVREETLQEAILGEIISDYRTHMKEDDRRRLPGLIIELSNKHGYDPLFVAGLIGTESSFNNKAVSSAGARGLMQMIPYVGASLAREVGIQWEGPQTLHDPRVSIDLGLYYLRQLEERFGNLDYALAAYNMGPSLLEQKMATGFRPHGKYAGKVNGTYRTLQVRSGDIRSRVVAAVRL